MAFAIRDILEAQIAYLQNLTISKLYPYSSGYAVTGLRSKPGRFEAITPRVAT